MKIRKDDNVIVISGDDKGTKGKVIAGSGAGAVVAVGIAVAVMMQGAGYRSISVDDVRGTVDVVGETNNGQAYKGERLYSGDDVNVKKSSEMTMCVDNDKYVYADEETHFRLEASSADEASRIKIIFFIRTPLLLNRDDRTICLQRTFRRCKHIEQRFFFIFAMYLG